MVSSVTCGVGAGGAGGSGTAVPVSSPAADMVPPVLAMGGIENARFLMHCAEAHGTPAGNGSGLLGLTLVEVDNR